MWQLTSGISALFLLLVVCLCTARDLSYFIAFQKSDFVPLTDLDIREKRGIFDPPSQANLYCKQRVTEQSIPSNPRTRHVIGYFGDKYFETIDCNWNSLPSVVVNVDGVDLLRSRLDNFKYDYFVDRTGTGNRSESELSNFFNPIQPIAK